MAKQRHTNLPPPYLKRVWLDPEAEVDRKAYPWCLPLFRDEFDLRFETPITIIAGENGVGKSTLLEGIAVLAGFDESGGGPGYRAVDNSRARETGGASLLPALRATWLPKIGQGWFFRAESFFAVARYLDEVGGGRDRTSYRIRMARASSVSSRNAVPAPESSCSTSPNQPCRPIASSIS